MVVHAVTHSHHSSFWNYGTVCVCEGRRASYLGVPALVARRISPRDIFWVYSVGRKIGTLKYSVVLLLLYCLYCLLDRHAFLSAARVRERQSAGRRAKMAFDDSSMLVCHVMMCAGPPWWWCSDATTLPFLRRLGIWVHTGGRVGYRLRPHETARVYVVI